MQQRVCLRCGERLYKKGDELVCSYCGASYIENSSSVDLFRLVLEEKKLEELANARRLLWQATHERYPSKEKVVDASRRVLSISDEEFLAAMYLSSHDSDPSTLIKVLSRNVSISEAKEAFRWLLPSLSPRLIGPLHDFVDRHYENEEKTKAISSLEQEASKVLEGIYEPSLPRDVFLCYSSEDMPDVIEITDLLEHNGFIVFAAFRNLRHGKGAAENYLECLEKAMRSCSSFLFLSSNSSRQLTCDAMRVELPYFINELPDKPRIEYILEDYPKNLPMLAKMTLKKAFPSQEHCRSKEDLLLRLQSILSPIPIVNTPKEPKPVKEPSFDPQPKDIPEPKSGKELSPGTQPKPVKDVADPKLPKEPRLAPDLLEKKRAEAKKELEALLKPYGKPKIKGDTVFYGAYPQEKVTIAPGEVKAKFSALKLDANSCCAYDGNAYFKKGRGDKASYFLFQPIRWKVISSFKDGSVLAISEKILDSRPFDYRSDDYKKSSIKTFLESEFLALAFPDGAACLLETDGSVKVRLMNSGETSKAGDALAKAEPTEYAASFGLRNENPYWTKTHASKEGYLKTTNGTDGWPSKAMPSNQGIGIRPVVRIRLDDEAIAPAVAKADETTNSAEHESFYLEQAREYGGRLFVHEAGEKIYVTYGEYPSWEIKDASLINRLEKAIQKGTNTAVLDGARFEKVQGNGKWLLYSPIEWLVAENNGKEALLISKEVLDLFPGPQSSETNTKYKDSRIRAFLNGRFLSKAFPDPSALIKIKVENRLFAEKDLVVVPTEDDIKKAKQAGLVPHAVEAILMRTVWMKNLPYYLLDKDKTVKVYVKGKLIQRTKDPEIGVRPSIKVSLDKAVKK